MKTLVIFYSRADENYFGGEYRYITEGNTEKVAKVIANLTGAELFRIEQKDPYSAEYRTCISQAKADKARNARPEITSFPKIEEADVIFLGYPNYWGTMPMAVFTLLEKLDWKGKMIRPFCTHEGSGLSGSVKDIARSTKGAVVGKGLAICGSDVSTSYETIEQWVRNG